MNVVSSRRDTYSVRETYSCGAGCASKELFSQSAPDPRWLLLCGCADSRSRPPLGAGGVQSDECERIGSRAAEGVPALRAVGWPGKDAAASFGGRPGALGDLRSVDRAAEPGALLMAAALCWRDAKVEMSVTLARARSAGWVTLAHARAEPDAPREALRRVMPLVLLPPSSRPGRWAWCPEARGDVSRRGLASRRPLPIPLLHVAGTGQPGCASAIRWGGGSPPPVRRRLSWLARSSFSTTCLLAGTL